MIKTHSKFNTTLYRLVLIIPIIIGLIIVLFFSKKSDPTIINGFYFDTYVSIQINDYITPNDKEGLIDLVCYYNTILSPSLEDSLCIKINENKEYYVTEDLEKLMNISLQIAKETNGIVDPTIMPVYELYNFDPSNTSSPSDNDIYKALEKVNYSSITLENNRIIKNNSNTKITLGYIAKGYIADEIKIYLLNHGVKNAVINLGGNVLVLGDKDGGGYNIAIQNPFLSLPTHFYDNYEYSNDIINFLESLDNNMVSKINSNNEEYALSLSIKDKSVVTSGIYERYYIDNGEIMHHLLDTKTGKPVNNELVSVTIIGPSSTYCDAYSTTVFLMGLIDGMNYINSKQDYTAVFITKRGDIIYSSN